MFLGGFNTENSVIGGFGFARLWAENRQHGHHRRYKSISFHSLLSLKSFNTCIDLKIGVWALSDSK